jgi:hypothetical protein
MTKDLGGANPRFPNLMVVPSDFVGYTGNWYLLNQNATRPIGASGDASMVFTVADPALDIKIWDYNQNADVTGKSVPQGEKLGFRVDTNMYPAVDARYRSNVIDDSIPAAFIWPTTVYYEANNMLIDSTGTWTNWSHQVDISGTTCCPVWMTIYDMKYTNYTSTGPWMTWSDGHYGCNRIDSIDMYYNVTDNRFYTDNSMEFSYIGHTSVLVTPAILWKPNVNYCAQAFPNAATDGYIDLKVKDESNAQLNKLFN